MCLENNKKLAYKVEKIGKGEFNLTKHKKCTTISEKKLMLLYQKRLICSYCWLHDWPDKMSYLIAFYPTKQTVSGYVVTFVL